IDPAQAMSVSVGFSDGPYSEMCEDCREILSRQSSLDFDDLIMLTIELGKKEQNVLDRYQDRYQDIQVEEDHDTNRATYELINLLSRKDRNICVVGDSDQSIYKFRGANIENILNFEDDYQDAKVIFLEQNYRSTKTILDAANAVIGNNTSRKPKDLRTV